MRILLTVCAAALAIGAQAADLANLHSDYETLLKWQYAAAMPLTQPVTIERDTAKWTLASGTIALAQPTAAGRITGLVWQGEGRFTMSVPDRFELAQLRRFIGAPGLRTIDEPITEMVFRVSDDTLDKLFPAAAKASAFSTSAAAEKRQNHWLIDLQNDVDARIIAAIANEGLHITAGFKTAHFDWLTYDYDSARDEEIQLTRFDRAFAESWLSLDRAEDRTTDGRPGLRESRCARLNSIRVKADLTRRGRDSGGDTNQRTLLGHYLVEEEIVPTVDGVAAVTMELDSFAQNLAARDEREIPLLVLRDRIGARTSNFDKKIHDPLLTLIFPTSLKKNGTRKVVFEYDLETANYALGNTWYPTVFGAFDDHTARLELTVNKRNAVRAMGRRESATENERGSTSVWIVDKPTKMVTFATAERFQEVTLEAPGVPKVTSFGWSTGLDVGARVRNSGADVINSLQVFQQMFACPIGCETFYVTSISGYHGQAFDCFLHLAESSYSEHPGASELFRAHEAAHEWFGHSVGWRTYRDQWLSEAFAEYAAMFFVKTTVKDGQKYFNEILDVYDFLLRGDMRGAFSKFNRPWLLERSSAKRARIGPIGHGFRAATADMPAGYLLQTYYKGPLVLHMLRQMLLVKTRSDDLFFKILRDFVHDYDDKLATTADFQRIVERDAPGDWDWFFDQWVYGAEIPTIRWSYSAAPSEGGKYKLNLTIKRSDTAPDFLVIAPVRVEFDGDKSATFFVSTKQDEITITREMPLSPRNVVFAPDHSLLANVKKE